MRRKPQDFTSATQTGVTTNLLGVEDNFLELSSFRKALNDLIGDVGSEVDAEGESRIHRLDQVSQLLRALQLQTHRKTCTTDTVTVGELAAVHLAPPCLEETDYPRSFSHHHHHSITWTHTLSSFNHFSSSCLRPCWRTGLQSSKDSNLLSWP